MNNNQGPPLSSHPNNILGHHNNTLNHHNNHIIFTSQSTNGSNVNGNNNPTSLDNNLNNHNGSNNSGHQINFDGQNSLGANLFHETAQGENKNIGFER